MLTFLDLLVIVYIVLLALSLLSLCLMFLMHNPKVKKVCFYVVAALAIYSAYIGIRIGGSLFPGQTAFGLLVGIAGIAAIVLELLGKGNERKSKIARIIAAVALVVGVINSIL